MLCLWMPLFIMITCLGNMANELMPHDGADVQSLHHLELQLMPGTCQDGPPITHALHGHCDPSFVECYSIQFGDTLQSTQNPNHSPKGASSLNDLALTAEPGCVAYRLLYLFAITRHTVQARTKAHAWALFLGLGCST